MISPPKARPIPKGWIELPQGDGNIYNGDAVEMLHLLPDESVDLCIFDPAYESLEKHRATGTTTRLSHSKGSSNDWFPTFPNSRYSMLFTELYRVMKKGTFAFMFCDEETRDVVVCSAKPQDGVRFEEPPPALEAGFKYWKAIIWDKMTRGMGYHFPAQHEFICMFEKTIRKNKHRRLNYNNVGDVISVPALEPFEPSIQIDDVLHAKRLKGKAYYPTEKPPELYDILTKEGSNEGDVVLDMFAGSGVAGQVARACGRRFLLGDINVREILKRLR